MTRARGSSLDLVFLALLGGLVLLGFILIASATWPLGFEKFDNGYYFLQHQLIFGLPIGVVGFLVMARLPYTNLRRWAIPMLVLSLFLLVLVFIPGIGAEFGSSRSWISLGAFSFQPSEIVKLTFLIYLAAWLEKRSQVELRTFATGLLPFGTLMGIIALLLLMQPDTGTLAIIVASAVIVYAVAGAPIYQLVGVGLLGVGVLALLLNFSEYREARFKTFLHPELDPLGVGYHINQALLAIGSGGMFGRGYGHSLQKFQYLPEVAGDSIFPIIAEELGFFLTSLFLFLYLTFLLRGVSIGERAPDLFGKYLVLGIMSWFGVQAMVNIGAMVGLLPITGVPLPFISYGGTALIVCLTAAGVVVNVSGAKRSEE